MAKRSTLLIALTLIASLFVVNGAWAASDIPQPAAAPTQDGPELTEEFEALGMIIYYPEGWAAELQEGEQIMLTNQPELLETMSNDVDLIPEPGQYALMFLPVPLADLGGIDSAMAFEMLASAMSAEGEAETSEIETFEAGNREVSSTTIDVDEDVAGVMYGFEAAETLVVVVGAGNPGDIENFEDVTLSIIAALEMEGEDAMNADEDAGDEDEDTGEETEVEAVDVSDVELDAEIEGMGISLSYPTDWAAEVDEMEGGIVLANSAEILEIVGDSETGPESGQFGMIVMAMPLADLGGIDGRTAFEMMAGFMASESSDESDTEVKDVVLGDLEAYRIDVSAQDGADGFVIGIETDEALVLAVAVSAVGEIDDFEGTALAIISTIEYTAP